MRDKWLKTIIAKCIFEGRS
uniref:Uncharacterized protein n=1 Tax=Vitis vinifera TaxID=29760 RepID=F6I203_VITVI